MNTIAKTIILSLTLLFIFVSPASAQTFDYSNCEAPGDVNHNGFVDVTDSSLVARYLFFDLSLDGRCLAAADMNRDGDITLLDIVDTSLYGAAVIPTTYTCDSIPADIDGDCVVDYLDALAASKIDAGLAQLQGTDITSCDVRADGRINVLDALLIAQISEGIITSIPRTCDAYTECSDTLDNDDDGFIDLNDPDCENSTDDDEGDGMGFVPRCADGIDNDGDQLIDLADPGCSSSEDDNESDGPAQGTTQCSDLIDNDNDSAIDYPQDSGCENAADNSEGNGTPVTPACYDGIDNDNDNLIDFPADPGCASVNDNDEHGTGACDDSIDNDLDGLVDLADPQCNGNPRGPGEGESPACSDSVDNDGDGLTDFPADPDCESPTDTGEGNLGAPRAEETSEPHARIFVSNLGLDKPYEFLPGQSLHTTITFSNIGEVTLHHVKARVSIPELGILRSVGPFTLNRGRELTQLISLDVPNQIAPGIYDVRITIYADEEGAQRAIHRTLEITSSQEDISAQAPIVHYVTTVYCPLGYSSCQAIPVTA